MSVIGESRMGKEIGNYRTERYYWVACIDCGKARWVGRSLGSSDKEEILKNNKCNRCRQLEVRQVGVESPFWRGGRARHGDYIMVRVEGDSPYFSMLSKSQQRRGWGYVLEHRLVMAQHLGRPLGNNEVVHHLNAVKDDNRMENLAMLSKEEHGSIEGLVIRPKKERPSDIYIKLLQARIRELEGLDKPISIDYVRRAK